MLAGDQLKMFWIIPVKYLYNSSFHDCLMIHFRFWTEKLHEYVPE
jgi:hypothetical protein